MTFIFNYILFFFCNVTSTHTKKIKEKNIKKIGKKTIWL